MGPGEGKPEEPGKTGPTPMKKPEAGRHIKTEPKKEMESKIPKEQKIQPSKPSHKELDLMMDWDFFKRRRKSLDAVVDSGKEIESASENLVNAVRSYTDAVKGGFNSILEALDGLYKAGEELENKVKTKFDEVDNRLKIAEENIKELGEKYNILRNAYIELSGAYNNLKEEVEGLRKPMVAFKKLMEATLEYQPRKLEEVKIDLPEINLVSYNTAKKRSK